MKTSHHLFNCWTSSREAVNTNFYSLCFDLTGNQTRFYRCSSRHSTHSTTDRLKLNNFHDLINIVWLMQLYLHITRKRRRCYPWTYHMGVIIFQVFIFSVNIWLQVKSFLILVVTPKRVASMKGRPVSASLHPAATQLLSKKCRSGGESLQHCIGFGRPGIWTLDLPLRRRRRYRLT